MNPWKTILIIGKKGSGKSSDIVAQCKKFINRKYRYWDQEQKKWIKGNFKVYSNFPIMIEGVRVFDPKQLGYELPERGSLILIDEINLLWDNRNFKSFPKEMQEFLRLSRQNRYYIRMYSQTFDCDRKIRQLCDQMWLCSNFMITFSLLRKIDKSVTIKSDALNADSQVVDDLHFAPWFIPGNWKFHWLPSYFKYHNSYRGIDKPLIYYDEIKKEGIGTCLQKKRLSLNLLKKREKL